MRFLILFCLSILSYGPLLVAQDSLRLSGIFKDGLVLQRGVEVPIWGKATPGVTVTVQFADQKKEAVTAEDGSWMVKLQSMPAETAERELIVQAGEESVVCKQVLVGEVWIAAGQSNMNAGGPNRDSGVYPFHQTPSVDGLPAIRIVRFGWGGSLEPLSDYQTITAQDGDWKDVKESDFTSVNNPIQFARILRDELRVPIGIIHVAVSGTNQAAWMHRKTLESFSSSKFANFYEEMLAGSNEKISKDKKLQSWENYKKCEAEWMAQPKGRSPESSTVQNFPTALYNTRIHPLAPYAIQGVIWHQGEAGPGGPYGERLVAMIQQWREHFGQNFHFIWGTLGRTTSNFPPLTPSFDYFYRSATNSSIRQALSLFGDDPKVALVEFYDAGDTETHWLMKMETGRRLGLAALQLAYGMPQIYTGPQLKNVTLEGASALVQFDCVGEGLKYLPSIGGISGVVVQSKKGPLVWANVEVVKNDTLKLTHPAGEDIVLIGYGINRNPHETIFNSAGLPASPFGKDVGRISYNPTGPQMLILDASSKKMGRLNLAHVREDGYRFKLEVSKGVNKSSSYKLKAFVPTTWKNPEVVCDGEPVAFNVVEDAGLNYLELQVPSGETWVTVCMGGESAKFSKIDRY